MKNCLKGILIVCFSLVACSGFCQHTLTITFSGINTIQGKIMAGLYNCANDFMQDGKEISGCMTVVEGEEVICIIEDVPTGTYALSVFHDENNNTVLDTGFLGIPKEGYGFSNNPKSTFGPPSFEESCFKVTNDLSLEIKL